MVLSSSPRSLPSPAACFNHSPLSCTIISSTACDIPYPATISGPCDLAVMHPTAAMYNESEKKPAFWVGSLLLVLLGVVTAGTLGGLGALALNTAGAATAVGRLEGEVDVLLRVETDDERGDVDDLLADADVALADEDTGVVDRLGEAELEDLGLETALKEVLGLEGKDVVETHAGVVKDTNADETTDKSVALEETLGVLLVELQEVTSSTTDLGEGELNAPDLALVAETVLAGELYVSTSSLGDCAISGAIFREVLVVEEQRKRYRRGRKVGRLVVPVTPNFPTLILSDFICPHRPTKYSKFSSHRAVLPPSYAVAVDPTLTLAKLNRQ